MPMYFDLNKYKNSVFVETGTLHGKGVTNAINAGFEKIYSIEINEKFYKNLIIKFENKIKIGKVNLILGDSSKCLYDILKNINSEITFWLDAHYSSGDTGRGDKDVPLLEELDIIAQHPIKTHTILIDDIRLFGTTKYENWSEIQFEKIIKKLKGINENYLISYENGEIENDVLVAKIRDNNL